jgi:hypothetical protein
MNDLKKLNSLYYKREKGKIVEGTGPVLYPKVLQQKKKSKDSSSSDQQSISTLFYDENGVDIDPMTLLEKHCYTTAAIKIESIFVGAKISIQVKVHEAEVSIIGGAPKRLLSRKILERPQPTTQVIMNATDQQIDKFENLSIKDSDSSSDSDDEPPKPITTKAAVPVKRGSVKK